MDRPPPEGRPEEELERALTAVRRALRARRYSPRTEKAYLGWIARFARFHGRAPLSALGQHEVDAYLTHLAVANRVSASTQNQAASALVFLFRELGHPLPGRGGGVVRARRGVRLPEVLSQREVARVLRELSGRKRLIGALLYGSGLRVQEALGLRVKDLRLELREVVVRQAKGRKDRITMVPDRLREALARQIAWRRGLHDQDLAAGAGWIELPGAYERKSPRSAREAGWQYLFPAARLSRDPMTGRRGRVHLHPSAMQRAVKEAVRRAGVERRVTCHTFRHSFATHLLQQGYDIRTIQELLGHSSVRTTMIYTHVLNRPGLGVLSPLDRMDEDG
jgi:integron integrase